MFVKTSRSYSEREMKYLVIVATFVIGIVSGLSPTLMSHLKRKDTQQFGKCSLEETQDIFIDYPNSCYSAFEDLRRAVESNSKDQETYNEIYTQVCSEECIEQIKTFSQECEASQYTDPISHACEQNTDTGDFCLSTVYINDGTKAAADCYSALAIDQCSETCRMSLEELAADLGCCVNAVFNVTTFGYDKLNIVSHELWELCGIDDLQPCNNSPLSLAFSGAQQQNVAATLLLVLICFASFL